MSISLFKIQEEYQKLANQIIEAGGELTDELATALEINNEMLQEKAINYGYIIRQAEAEAEMIDAEIERLRSLKSSRSKAITLLKDSISAAMSLYGIEKLESPMLKLSFRKSESVEIKHPAEIPFSYLVAQDPKIDKIAIKEAIKNGETIPGAVIITKFNLQIK